MKAKVLLLTVVLMMFTVASLAVDKPSFSMDYLEGGIDYAVTKQLEVGTPTYDIISDAMLVDGITRRDIIEALQNAGVEVCLMDAVGRGSVSTGNRHTGRTYASPSKYKEN